MRRSIVIQARVGIATLLLIGGQAFADDRSAPFGRWATSGTLIEVAPAGESLSARLIGLKHPLYREKDQSGVVGTPKLDDRNPEQALRDRPLLGLELLGDFVFRNGHWEGSLYVPENGRTFSARLWVKNGLLKIRGSLFGMPWFGRSKTLQPLGECNADIQKMIERTPLPDAACATGPSP